MLYTNKYALLKTFFFIFLLSAISASTLTDAEEKTDRMRVAVRDFGAIPDDSACDAIAIRAAVASVATKTKVRLVFEPGVYNLSEASVATRQGRLSMVHLWGLDDWVIEGAVDGKGNPATKLEMNLKLRNEVTGARHLDVRDCKRIHVKNLIIDQNPRMATAAKVLDVDQSSGRIEIEVLEGMPHFDGMFSFSANNWDLNTKLLIPGPAVTIGTNAAKFGKWSAIPGSPGHYSIRNESMAKLLKPGQGLSFHFNIVIPQGRSIDVYRCEDIIFENILVHNAIGMVMGAGDNRNMTFKRFHVKPEGNSLAVGPRDGIHISRSTGHLLMEDVIVRGVRWDPIVSYKYSAPIAERVSDQAIRLDPSNSKSAMILKVLKKGGQVHFWTGTNPTVREVAEVSENVVGFTSPLDASVKAGGIITPGEWHWEKAVIRDCIIESNYGTAIVYECDNLLVENCIFNNNAYSNIGLGATSKNAGLYTRHIVIRNNTFKGSTWEPKYSGSYLTQHRGTITLFNRNPFFRKQRYHRNILIENNLFQNLTGRNQPGAVDIKLAEDVTVRNNRYENVSRRLYIDEATTARVNFE